MREEGEGEEEEEEGEERWGRLTGRLRPKSFPLIVGGMLCGQRSGDSGIRALVWTLGFAAWPEK